MIRQISRTMFAALVAVLMIASIGEAAPQKSAKHRAHHSTRVTRSASASKKGATRAKRTSKNTTTHRTTTKPH
jgi:hypothetical protein